MNFIMFIKIIILMMSCTSSTTNTDITNLEVDVGVPIHNMITGGTVGLIDSYDFEIIESYYDTPYAWNYFGAKYIKPDGTLWENDRREEEKIEEDVVSVVDGPLTSIMKTDGSVWVSTKHWPAKESDIVDEYVKYIFYWIFFILKASSFYFTIKKKRFTFQF